MPGPVEAGLRAWLQAPAKYANAANAALPAGLQGAAVDQEVISPLAVKAAAQAENARQIAFLGRPLALDRHIVKGQRRDLIAKPITLKGDKLGYEAGIPVFVIEVDEREDDMTALTVLRKL